MAALLGHPASIQHDDLVGQTRRAKAVRNKDGRFPGADLPEEPVDLSLIHI